MSLVVKIEGLAEFKADVSRGASSVGGSVKWAMVQSVNAVKNSAQQYAPFKTGTLRRSIHADVTNSGFTGTVLQNPEEAPYGAFIEYGTSPHEITPVNKKALFWKGALNPYRRVMHPGTAAHPFMTPAMENNIDNIQRYFSEALGKVVKIMAGKG